jgi:anti-sigma factor RsiW
MTNKTDWDSAYRDVVDRGRERLGDPPSPEELIAFSRGELPEAEAERIRELLAYYPDLAVALAEGDDIAMDEAPVLNREQIEADWQLLQHRMSPVVSPHVAAAATQAPAPRWMWLAALAPAVLFAGLFFQSRFIIRELRQQITQPQVLVERIELFENVTRGATSAMPVKLQTSTEQIVLVLTVTEDVSARAFRVQIRNLDSSQVVWKGNVNRGRDGTFSIVVPRSFLTAQAYEVDLFGDDRQIATYAFWLRQQ